MATNVGRVRRRRRTMDDVLYERLPAGDLLYQFDVVHVVGRAFELLEDAGYANEYSRIEVRFDLRRYTLGELSPTPPRGPSGAEVDPAEYPEGPVTHVFSIPLRRDAMAVLREHLETLRALRVPVWSIVARGEPRADP
jgi:hypothetical protein